LTHFDTINTGASQRAGTLDQEEWVAENRIRLLIIDDDPDMRQGIKLSLEHEGIEVRGAAGGEEGIALARSMHPDIIVLDVEMPPGIGGAEVCRRIRSEEALDEIPIIFLTARVDLDAMEETVEEEAQGYLLKPFSEGDLLDKISEVLGREI
jgi:CheY-like chemotaxis protein